jgi:hypothetical protein
VTYGRKLKHATCFYIWPMLIASASTKEVFYKFTIDATAIELLHTQHTMRIGLI